MRQRRLQMAGVACFVLLAYPSGASAAQTHVVRPGDTLWAIAGRYEVSVGALASANHLSDPDALRLGQRLVIPTARAPSVATASARRPTRFVQHVVTPGDTLWSIARRHSVSVEAIVQGNRLSNPDALRLGQRLTIPVPAPRPQQRSGRPAATRVQLAARRAPISSAAMPSRGAKWGSALLTAGARLVGVRYRWGGMTPRGFDCSGFIGYIMRAVGVSVPRTTYAMWAQGRPVSRDEVRVGDIVFFNTTRPGPSHAGIYIGNNQFIHSSSGFGRVTVTSMDYRYYKPRYLGARRF